MITNKQLEDVMDAWFSMNILQATTVSIGEYLCSQLKINDPKLVKATTMQEALEVVGGYLG